MDKIFEKTLHKGTQMDMKHIKILKIISHKENGN